MAWPPRQLSPTTNTRYFSTQCAEFAGRRAPPILPRAIFGTVVDELAKLAQDKGAPLDYVALGFLTVAASIIVGVGE